MFYVSQTPPWDKFITNTWLNSCCHLLRILSVLSISSSKVVFTDRLCGERSLSATWPVIFSSVGKHRHLLGVPNNSRGKCSECTGTVYGAYDRLQSGERVEGGVPQGPSATVPHLACHTTARVVVATEATTREIQWEDTKSFLNVVSMWCNFIMPSHNFIPTLHPPTPRPEGDDRLSAPAAQTDDEVFRRLLPLCD